MKGKGHRERFAVSYSMTELYSCLLCIPPNHVVKGPLNVKNKLRPFLLG